jgi:hypothetical protein
MDHLLVAVSAIMAPPRRRGAPSLPEDRTFGVTRPGALLVPAVAGPAGQMRDVVGELSATSGRPCLASPANS